jgi:hypothetical protein
MVVEISPPLLLSILTGDAKSSSSAAITVATISFTVSFLVNSKFQSRLHEPFVQTITVFIARLLFGTRKGVRPSLPLVAGEGVSVNDDQAKSEDFAVF